MKKSNFAHFIKEIKKAVYSYITTLQYTKAYVSRQNCESFTVSWAAGTNQAVQKFNLSFDILKYITIIWKIQILIKIEIYSIDGSWLILNKFWNNWTIQRKYSRMSLQIYNIWHAFMDTHLRQNISQWLVLGFIIIILIIKILLVIS